MNTFPVHGDVPILEFLHIEDIYNLKRVSKNTKKFAEHNPLIEQNFNKAACIIQRFFKYSSTLFKLSEKFDSELLYEMNPNSHFFHKYKFISLNLLYMKEYSNSNANHWIKGNSVPWKINTIKNYFDFDTNKSYNKYDLNKLLTQMNIDDIFLIGF
jgi:hypothetical protein